MGIEKLELNHVSDVRFLYSGFGILELTRDKTNRIDGFIILNLGRLQNVKFAIVSK